MTSVDSNSGPDLAQARYSVVAMTLHWLLALGMVFQVALGFAMPHSGPHSFVPMQLHKSVGITILVLTLIRLGWRLRHRPPEAIEGGWTGLVAKAVHLLFYAILLLGPITGWIIVSTARLNVPTVVWGVIPWPHLPLPGSINASAEGIHEILSWAAVVLFVLHVAGALRHQFLLHDPVLKRIAPGGSVAAALCLLLASIILYFATGSYVAGKYLVPAMSDLAEAQKERAMVGRQEAPANASSSPTTEPEIVTSPDVADVATSGVPGPPPIWTIQRGKRLAFSVGNGDSRVSGTFEEWRGTISFDPDRPESANLKISVDLASASVGDATQDAMLQGADFFASAVTPRATWDADEVVQTSPGHYRAKGTLTLKGASRPQTVDFVLTGRGLNRHVIGVARIDRKAFGIGMGEAGDSLSRSVSLDFSFNATGRAR